jgi:hypothetical protein
MRIEEIVGIHFATMETEAIVGAHLQQWEPK